MKNCSLAVILCVLCVFLGPIDHTQFSDLLSVPNQSKEKRRGRGDAENATQLTATNMSHRDTALPPDVRRRLCLAVTRLSHYGLCPWFGL